MITEPTGKRQRGSEQPWRRLYKTAQWKALRLAHLRHHPLCEACNRKGFIVSATVAHHRTPHRGDTTLFFSPDNLESLCSDCHDIDAQRIENGGSARVQPHEDGWPGDLSLIHI